MKARNVIILLVIFILCYLLIPFAPQASCQLRNLTAGEAADCTAVSVTVEGDTLDVTGDFPAHGEPAAADYQRAGDWWPAFIAILVLAAWLTYAYWRQRRML